MKEGEGERYEHSQERQRYDHSHEGEMVDYTNLNSPTEIVKMHHYSIVEFIDVGQITNPEAAIIIIEKLQRDRNEMTKGWQDKAEQQPLKEQYSTAIHYAEDDAHYAKYLIGEPPSPVRYCIEEAQKRIEEADLSSGYAFIKADDDLIRNNPELVKKPRKYNARACDIAAGNYRAAANWYTMAAELARRQEETPEASPPPEEDH